MNTLHFIAPQILKPDNLIMEVIPMVNTSLPILSYLQKFIMVPILSWSTPRENSSMHIIV